MLTESSNGTWILSKRSNSGYDLAMIVGDSITRFEDEPESINEKRGKGRAIGDLQ
jgi:hypothetical protein